MTAEPFERLVKSTERVRDLGEVFTPAATVHAMLDLLPTGMWDPHPSPTFLEPACGDGNFLVAILNRKLDSISKQIGTFPAGNSDDHIMFHALEALASIYAVDISADNIVGGTPGHEIGARTRMLNELNDWHNHQFGKRVEVRSVLHATAQWIVDRNIQVGNMLAVDSGGRPSGRDRLPLVDYDWNPTTLNVTVTATTLGDVMADAGKGLDVGGQGAFSFDEPAPAVTWTGKFTDLCTAPIDAPTSGGGDVRNGNGRR